MRTLAARLGVRASSLYRHFPDRLAIENALARRAALQLLDCMQQAAENQTGDRALFAAARAYLDYATSESSFYDILMQCASTGSQPSDTTKKLHDFFLHLLPDDVPGAAALWSFLHGFAVLSRSGQLGESIPRSTFTRGVQALLRGLATPDADAARMV